MDPEFDMVRRLNIELPKYRQILNMLPPGKKLAKVKTPYSDHYVYLRGPQCHVLKRGKR